MANAASLVELKLSLQSDSGRLDCVSERYFSRNVCCSEDTSVSVWLDVFVCFFVQDALCSTQRLREFTV